MSKKSRVPQSTTVQLTYVPTWQHTKCKSHTSHLVLAISQQWWVFVLCEMCILISFNETFVVPEQAINTTKELRLAWHLGIHFLLRCKHFYAYAKTLAEQCLPLCEPCLSFGLVVLTSWEGVSLIYPLSNLTGHDRTRSWWNRPVAFLRFYRLSSVPFNCPDF